MLSKCNNNEVVRYLYVRRHDEDKNVVPYNPEIAILWGDAHNMQVVSKHGFEMYLAEYISKPEPSLKIDLSEKCSAPQRFLRTRVVGSVEVLDVLMGFHQNQMSRQVVFLQTELAPQQRMLKPIFQINSLPKGSQDIYSQTKLETYLNRPAQLVDLTYPEFYLWWRFAKYGVSNRPWGGRHVILLSDPAQLPAVSRSDIFATHLWLTFSVMLLRETMRCQDPVLSGVLNKVRMGAAGHRRPHQLTPACQCRLPRTGPHSRHM